MSTLRPEDNKTYEKLTRQFPLRPIRDDEQNDRAAEICNSLTERLGDLSPAERDYLEVLSDLIAKYESRWDDEVAIMSPREVVEYLMEQNGLAQVDLVSEFGSRSRVSDVLSGKRRVSLEQAKRLSDRFKLDISLFIEKPASIQIKADKPMTYKAFFDAVTEAIEKRWSKRRLEGGHFATAYSHLISLIKESLAPALAAEYSIDIDLSGISESGSSDPENSEVNADPHLSTHFMSWSKRRPTATYGDFTGELARLVKLDIKKNPRFWNKKIDLAEPEAAIDQFANDLNRELGKLVKKK
jgi:HTH-type transcriptional regulator/antitoxin HigA